MTSTALTTKRVGLIWLAIGLFAGLALSMMIGAGSTAKAQIAQTGFEEVRTDALEYNFAPGSKKSASKVWIRGSGFEPGTEVFTLIADGNGVLTDITIPAEKKSDGGGSVYPLIANNEGAWATMWTVGRFTRSGVGGEGMFSLLVMDTNFDTLATTPIALCNNSGGRAPEVVDAEGNVTTEAEAVPDYCSA